MMTLREMLDHLGLNADHPGEVLKSDLELTIGRVDPRKRDHRVHGIELHTEFADTATQGTTEELERQE